MTPQETADAMWAMILGEDTAGFDRLCDQLRAGVLVLKSGPDGYTIQARPDGEHQR